MPEPTRSANRAREGTCHAIRHVAAAALILISAAAGTAAAQYKIDSWTTEHGLPQGTVSSVTQTPDGFLWLSTFGGLVRFDGVAFRVFNTVTNPELPNSRLTGAVVDRDGQLWIMTEDLVLMQFRDGRFSKVEIPMQNLRGIQMHDGRMGVASYTEDELIWQDGAFVPYTRRVPPGAAGMTRISATPAYGDEQITWYRDDRGMAHRFVGDRLTRSVALPPGNVAEDRTGRLWMKDPQRGGDLLCFDGATVTSYGRKDGLIGVEILHTMEDRDGTMWFVQPQGLARFRDGRFSSFTKADGLPDTHIRSVIRDREGTLWVSTQGGLARFTEQPVVTYTTRDGLAADNTYPILEDRRGDIWIGGWPGLTRYRAGAFEDVTAALGLAPQLRPSITALMEDRDGALWVATLGRGIQRLKDGRVTTIIDETVDWNYYAMFQSRSGDIWIAGDRGAHRYHDGVLDPALHLGAAASVFHEDARGVLWIGGVPGLFRYEGGVVTQIGEPEGFSGKRVRAIRSDPDGTMWIGTYDTGLFRYREGRFTRYTTAEGLPANGAFEILEDAEQRFWICSNSGIYRVARAELDDVAAGGRRSVTAVRYGRNDGMANQECNGLGRPAGIRASDGRFWFPTQGGVAVVNPTALARTSPPPVALLDVKVAGVSASSLDRIEIRSGSTSIEAKYAALTFVRPELAQFKFMMEGLETDWNDGGTDRTARYPRLPYGNFRFRVIAANREGVWNEEGAGIDIIVVPPFWRTTWFMALMMALAASAAYGGHRWRLASIQQKQAVQQAFARQLIDSQELDRKRIASDLHDGVSQTLVVIRNWARIGVPTHLGDIAEAASQALGEVRSVVHDLLPLHLERMGLVEAMRDAATRVGDASGIAITTRLDAVDSELSTETALRLFRVAQEGLNNVVKHSGATTASLDLTLVPGHVRLTIEDNGKGFQPGDISPTSAGDGFGLVGMAERARMMGGGLTITSAPGRGTTIIIIVPQTAGSTGQQGGGHAGDGTDSNSDR